MSLLDILGVGARDGFRYTREQCLIAQLFDLHIFILLIYSMLASADHVHVNTTYKSDLSYVGEVFNSRAQITPS